MPTVSKVAGRQPLVFACYFLTGSFGLCYEVVWSRYLALMIGNTAHAHTAVLATFMGGLALGAWIFGGVADRVRNGLRVYGWLEVVVGLLAISFPQVFALWEAVLGPVAAAAGPGTATLSAFKIAFAALCVLPPTVLMGGTLPILTRYLTADPSGLRAKVSSLYALNAAGAVVGGLLAGFVLLPRLGMATSILGVGVLNCLLGLVAVLAGRIWPAVEPEAEQGAGAEDAADYDPRWRRLAVLLAGFSGFATMCLEVAWLRWLGLMLGSSTYAFSLMLAAFISGIALGSAWLARRGGRYPLIPLLAGAMLVTAGALWITTALYEPMPWLLGRARFVFREDPAAYWAWQLWSYGLCFVLMLVPTAVAGLVFPATVRIATEAGRMGGRLGRVYAVNTVGTLTGAALTGLFFFSWFGLEWVLRGVLIAYAIAAGGLAFYALEGRTRKICVGLSAALLLGHFIAYTPADPRMLTQGLYRRSRPLSTTLAEQRRLAERDKLLYYDEGPHAVVAVREHPARSPSIDAPWRSLVVNGKADASTGEDMSTQIFIGQLPMLLHPNPQRAFLVGLGSGVTAGSMLTHGVELEVAEISEQVVEAERFFRPWNNTPLARATLYVEDARTVLRHRDRKYDVIASEPTNPWQAGIAGLFSVDFFDLVRSRLEPGGIFCQWIHTYEMDDPTLDLVLASLQARFPYVYVFEPSTYDAVLIASDHALDARTVTERMRLPAVKADLRRIGGHRPWVVLATQVLSPSRLRRSLPQGQINSDDRPILEFEAPKAFFAHAKAERLPGTDERLGASGGLLIDALGPPDAEDVAALHRLARKEVLSDQGLAALWRLTRRHLGAGHRATLEIERRLLQQNPTALAVDWKAAAPEVGVGALRTRYRLALSGFDKGYHRWDPIPTGHLEALLDAMQAKGAEVETMRRAMLHLVCGRGLREACERQAGLLESKRPGEALAARARAALYRQDVEQAHALLSGAKRVPNELRQELIIARAVQAFYAQVRRRSEGPPGSL